MQIVSNNNRTDVQVYQDVKLLHSELMPTEKIIYHNSQLAKVNTFNNAGKVVLVNKIIEMASLMLRTNSGDKDIEDLQKQLLIHLDRFKFLSGDEILFFTNKGLSGDYLEGNQFVFFNVSNWLQWGKKFIDNEKAEVMKKIALSAKVEESKPIPTDKEMKAEAIRIANNYILKTKEKSDLGLVYEFIGGLNYLYDVVDSFGFILFTPERKQKIYNDCNQDVNLAKSEAYKLWITEMAEAGLSLDENGEMV